MWYTSHSCWLLFLSGQFFRTLQTPMELASSSKTALDTNGQHESLTASSTDRLPWALPIWPIGLLNSDEPIPPPTFKSQFISQTSGIKPEDFNCKVYIKNLERKDLAIKEMPQIKDFVEEFSRPPRVNNLVRPTGIHMPVTEGFTPQNAEYPTAIVQGFIKSLLINNKMSEEHYGPWIDTLVYLIKDNLEHERLEPAIEHMLYGLQSLAIKHLGRENSHLTRNLKMLVDALIEKAKERHGPQLLRAWAHELVFPEKGLSRSMRNFENFKKAVSYEPRISTFLEELMFLTALNSKTVASDSPRGDTHDVSEITKLIPTKHPEVDTIEHYTDLNANSEEIFRLYPGLRDAEIRKRFQDVKMGLLQKSLSKVISLALPETAETSAQTKTAVILLLYHLALPSLGWTKDTRFPKWAENTLQILENQETPLSQCQILIEAIRKELGFRSLREVLNT